MKKIALIIVCMLIAFYFSACDDGLGEEVNEDVVQGGDENVTVVIDEIKISEQLPQEFIEMYRSEPPVLKEGNMFAIAYFHVGRVEDIYLRGFNESSIFDEQGNSYNPIAINVDAIYNDQDDFFEGRLGYVYEGMNGRILYEIPKQVKLVEIVLAYLYSATEDGDIKENKKVVIPLSNVNQ